jgi:Trypsin
VPVSSQQVYPQADAWVAAIYTSAQGGSPVGGGVIIDERRVLTCAHVVMPNGVTLARLRCPTPKAVVGTKW